MKNSITTAFGRKLKELRLEHGYTMKKLCELYNEKFQGTFNKGTLSRYESGLQEPLFSTVGKLSNLLNSNVEYMMGRSNNKYAVVEENHFKKTIPILGLIAAGHPMLATENIEGYEHTDDESVDYCLRVQGSSMIGARIFEGDLVFIDKDAAIENGDIVVALIDDENATIKRYYRYNNIIILKPENPTMKEIEFNINDANLRILGKVKEVKFKL